MNKRKNEQEHQARIEMLEYQIGEIEAANLQSGEDTKLLKQRDKLMNHKLLLIPLTNAYVLS